MKEFIDDFSIDEKKIHEEIIQWKKEFKKHVYQKEDHLKFLKNLNLASIIIAIFSLIILVVTLIIFLFMFKNTDLFFIIISITLLLSIIFGMIWILIRGIVRDKISRNVKSFLGNDGFGDYQKWFANAFQHENLSNDYKNLFATTFIGISGIINIYRHQENSREVTESYDIMGGTIFNNPFNLSCGIFQPIVRDTKSKAKDREYIPVFQIKTSQFLDIDIWVTNSRKFSTHTKNNLLFENKEFRKNYLIQTKNHVEALMLFTPLVQEKWAKLSKGCPKFQMHIRKGTITILFQGFIDQGVKSSYSKVRSFMNILHLYEKTPFEWIFLRNLEKNIMDDLKSFCAIINLVFSISYFQWENLTTKEKA